MDIVYHPDNTFHRLPFDLWWKIEFFSYNGIVRWKINVGRSKKWRRTLWHQRNEIGILKFITFRDDLRFHTPNERGLWSVYVEISIQETYQETPIIRRYYGYGLVRCSLFFSLKCTTRNNYLDKIPERDESPRSRGVYLYLHVGKSLYFTPPSTAEYPSLCRARLPLRRIV